MNELLARLTEPFDPKHISWKPGATKENKCMALAYGDLRAYMDKLDEVCGLDWSCRYVPWEAGRIICELTIAGVTRSSTGEHDAQDEKNNMPGTVAEAQAFKRACAMFGLGRFLYDLPSVWVEFDPQRKRITEAGQRELDTRYAAWYAKKKAAQKPRPSATPVEENLNMVIDPDTGEIIDGDVVFAREPSSAKQPGTLSQAQLTKIHILGADVHGAEWDKYRPGMVDDASGGRVKSTKELSPDEASVLIRNLEIKLKAKQPARNGVAA
jgi:hypothetical protein